MDDINLYNERERHWRIVFEENDGGVGNEKTLLHAKSWDIYVNEKENLVKGGYFQKFLFMTGRILFGNWWKIVS